MTWLTVCGWKTPEAGSVLLYLECLDVLFTRLDHYLLLPRRLLTQVCDSCIWLDLRDDEIGIS